MANLAFNRNGMLSKPKPMQPGLSPPIMGQKPMQPGPTIGGLGGSANDLAPAGVATRPPMMGTDRIPGKPPMDGRPPTDFGGMIGGPLGGAGGNPPLQGPPGWPPSGAAPGSPDPYAGNANWTPNHYSGRGQVAPPTSQQEALQSLFGGMPSGSPQLPQLGGQIQPMPNGGFGGAPGGGGISAPAPPMGGGMTATMDPRLMRRRFDPGLR